MSLTKNATRTVIVGLPPYSLGDNSAWLPPTEWKSLKIWWDLFDNVTLLKPELRLREKPQGWLEIPGSVKIEKLCDSSAGRFLRRKQSIANARRLLRDNDLLMIRMPYYESAWVYQVARDIGVRHFVEIHGDWETAVIEEDKNTVFRRVTRRWRASENRRVLEEISRTAMFALGVGPHLIEKYVPQEVPSLVSTNHLVKAADYKQRLAALSNEPKRILFVGELQRRKGLHVLFQSLRKIHEADVKFLMLLVGAGPMEGELVEMARVGGFTDKIKFVGPLPHGDHIYRYFETSDIFVLPSVAAEGVPRVIHEAMALGCPVVATDVGSVAWQLANNNCGVVVPPGDVEGLAEAIRDVLDNTSLQLELARRAFERSLDFTLEGQTARIHEFVRSQINGLAKPRVGYDAWVG